MFLLTVSDTLIPTGADGIVAFGKDDWDSLTH